MVKGVGMFFYFDFPFSKVMAGGWMSRCQLRECFNPFKGGS